MQQYNVTTYFNKINNNYYSEIFNKQQITIYLR